MTPAQDELASRRSGGNSRSRQPANSTGGSLLGLIAIVFAIAATGAAYFLWQQNIMLLAAVDDADKRISQLEAQLTSTGDELTQSDAAVRVQLKELNSEVAKLWDARKVSNKSIGQHETNIRNLTTRSEKLIAVSGSNEQQLTVIASELDEAVEAIEQVDPEAINNKLNSLSASQKTISGEFKSLESEVKDNTLWLQSIDEFRRQVNQRLNAIQNPEAQAPALQ